MDFAFLLLLLIFLISRALPGALTGYLQLLIPGIQSVLADKAPDVNMKIHTLHFITMAMNTHEPKVAAFVLY